MFDTFHTRVEKTTQKKALEGKDITKAFEELTQAIAVSVKKRQIEEEKKKKKRKKGDAAPPEDNPPLNLPIVAIVSGGGCSVLTLRPYSVTQKVDLLLSTAEHQEAMNIALDQLSDSKILAQFPPDWLVTKIPSIHDGWLEDHFYASQKKNNMLYRSDTLVVYAGHWKYQLLREIVNASSAMSRNGIVGEDGLPAGYKSDSELISGLVETSKASTMDLTQSKERLKSKSSLSSLNKQERPEREVEAPEHFHLHYAVLILHFMVKQNMGRPLNKEQLKVSYYPWFNLREEEIDLLNRTYTMEFLGIAILL